jgi:hypothetical protein
MDELAKTLLLQTPAIGVLLLFTIQLYRDMRTDAIEATRQRQESIIAIRELSSKMDVMISLLTDHPLTKIKRNMNSATASREGTDTLDR